MIVDPRSRVAEIVLEHPECARVFYDHRIDFCCRGERSFAEACTERGLDVEPILHQLDRAIALRRPKFEPDPRAMSTPELVSFIVSRHHAYLDEALRFLRPLTEKVAAVHGKRNPKLVRVRDTFRELVEALEPHIREEEAILFPALMKQAPDHQLVAAELAIMEQEHRQIGVMLARMRDDAEDFHVPDWTCGSYRTLMSELEAMELDTLRHVHLENYVLMSRFVAPSDGAERGVS